MRDTLWEKIEAIRQEPEHVRRRYVYGCLVVSMAFIFGIWTLSLKESFRSVTDDVPQAVEKGRELLPQTGTSSLSDLMEQAKPLAPSINEGQTGEEYFQGQLEKRAESRNEEMMKEDTDSNAAARPTMMPRPVPDTSSDQETEDQARQDTNEY